MVIINDGVLFYNTMANLYEDLRRLGYETTTNGTFHDFIMVSQRGKEVLKLKGHKDRKLKNSGWRVSSIDEDPKILENFVDEVAEALKKAA